LRTKDAYPLAAARAFCSIWTAIEGSTISSASRAGRVPVMIRELVVTGGVVPVHGYPAAERLRYGQEPVGAGTAVASGAGDDIVLELDRDAGPVSAEFVGGLACRAVFSDATDDGEPWPWPFG
jgi:hypothetical protein